MCIVCDTMRRCQTQIVDGVISAESGKPMVPPEMRTALAQIFISGAASAVAVMYKNDPRGPDIIETFACLTVDISERGWDAIYAEWQADIIIAKIATSGSYGKLH